eukprot:3652741-Prymnesium_polylepis.1
MLEGCVGEADVESGCESDRADVSEPLHQGAKAERRKRAGVHGEAREQHLHAAVQRGDHQRAGQGAAAAEQRLVEQGQAYRRRVPETHAAGQLRTGARRRGGCGGGPQESGGGHAAIAGIAVVVRHVGRRSRWGRGRRRC